MEYLSTAAEHLLPILLTILAGVLTALGTYALRWLRQKLGLERVLTDEQITAAVREIVAGAVAYAEQAERRWRSGIDPIETKSPRDKLDRALEWAVRELDRRDLPAQAEARLVDLIEAKLGSTPRVAELIAGEAAS